MLDADLLPLSDDRARLRPLALQDAAAYAEGTEDPAVRTHAHLPEPRYTPSSVRAMIRRDVEPGLQRGDLAVLTIADPATDSFAGSLVLFGVRAPEVEVGFWIHPAHRGKGLTAAALELGARFAAGSGLRRLTARTSGHNVASQRVLAASAFELVGHAVETAPDGQLVELLRYERPLGS